MVEEGKNLGWLEDNWLEDIMRKSDTYIYT